jgi:ribosomal protein S18 acetylase RimI-like enzyme
MPDLATYIAHEQLRDGCGIAIRALRPDDEVGMLAAMEQTSASSMRRRFFATKRHFSEKERAFFMDVDFTDHVALVALTEQAGRDAIVGGGRYVVVERRRAEMAFMVVDAWQGRGIGSILMRHLIKIAKEAGLEQLTAEVLPENAAMLKIFKKSGFAPASLRGLEAVHLVLKIG